jgi:WD40 repeat protein
MSDIFISYSRRDSDFAKRLNQELNNQSKDVWIDFEDIPRGIDFLDEIYDGIEKADSLCFLVSRHSLMSEICQLELAHAIQHNKRVLPLILEKVEGDVLKIVKGHWADMAWAELAKKNWDVLSHLNWLIFDEPSRFEAEFAALILAAEQDIIHLKTHTRLLVRAIDWQKAEKNPSFLLFGDEIDAAETWLKKWDELPEAKRPNPPPDSLHRDYSEASRQAEKNRQAELANYQTLIQQSQSKLKSEQRAGMITAGFGGLVIGVSIMMAYFLFQFLGSARTQAAELQTLANDVGTEVANANSQLTAIPPTLTQVAVDVQAAENRIESLRLASLAQEYINNPPTVEMRTIAYIPQNDETPVLLGIRALNTSYTSQADASLVEAMAQFNLLRRFEGHTETVYSIAFSPDGTLALSGAADTSLILWDIARGEAIRSFTGHTEIVSSVAFSPDGTLALSGAGDKTLILWDIASGEAIRTFTGHTEAVYSVAFSPDGTQALSGSADKTLILWDIASGEAIRTFTGHTEAVSSVAFSPDGTQALSSSADKTLMLWDIASGEAIRTFAGHNASVSSVAFSPDGTLALSGAGDASLILWDIASGEAIRSFTGHTTSIRSVAFSPDGTLALSGSADVTLILWDIASGQAIRTFIGETYLAYSLAFSPDGTVALSGSGGGDLILWEVESKQVLSINPRNTGLHGVTSVAFSPDGSLVLVGTQLDYPNIALWDIATGQAIGIYEKSLGTVTNVVFSPDGTQALIGTMLWDVTRGQAIRTFSGGRAAFSLDGTQVLSGSSELTLWDIASGQAIGTFTGPTGSYVKAFSPDRTQALSGSSDNTLILWDIASGQTLRTFTEPTDGLSSVAFSPNGTQIIGGSYDGSLILWDIASGEAIRTFTGHNAGVSSVAFSPDGTQIVSGSDSAFEDGSLILWDIASGEAIRTFTGHTEGVTSVAFSPDGRQIISGSWDDTLRVWHTDYHDFIAYACSRVTRDFAPEERQEYRILDDEPTCPQFGN